MKTLIIAGTKTAVPATIAERIYRQALAQGILLRRTVDGFTDGSVSSSTRLSVLPAAGEQVSSAA